MIIIGEKINGSSRSIKSALEKKDAAFVQDVARKQYEAGAAYLDINAGSFPGDEPQKLEWLVNVIQEITDVPFSIDSSNAKAIEAALKANKNTKPVINSITGEKERYDLILPLILQYNAAVIALCMDDNGMPETVDERVTIAQRLVENLVKEGISSKDIFIDPLVRPVGAGAYHGIDAMETIKKLKSEFPDFNIVCGISNISFGIPARNLMNQSFLVAAMISGVDAAILDPLDKKLMSILYATQTLMGKDEFCMNYQMKFREGLLEI
ncbi:MAG: methyltetrahydrofolate cobalamin methyltransferase [Bacillota bacterium]